MRKHVIIVAGGSGTRMGRTLPKQFIDISGKPIVVHTIEAFLAYDPSIHVVLVLPEAHVTTWNTIKNDFLDHIPVDLALGGTSRFQSVQSGLSLVENGLVAIHDAVRPLVSLDAIAQSFVSAEHHGSGVVMVPLKDSIRKQKAGTTVSKDRSLYLTVQTPQTFQVKLIQKAFLQEESVLFTDDASVYEAAGHQVTIVEGAYSNIKITTPEDLLIAEVLLSQK